MKVKVPKQIRIGAYDIQIRYDKNLIRNHRLLGQCLTDDGVIRIDPDIKCSSSVRDCALFHEIIHGVNDAYNCKLDDENIDRIAHGIVALMKNDLGLEFDWSDITPV